MQGMISLETQRQPRAPAIGQKNRAGPRVPTKEEKTNNALQKCTAEETPNFCEQQQRNVRSVRFIISSSSPSVVCRSVTREVELRSVKDKIRRKYQQAVLL